MGVIEAMRPKRHAALGLEMGFGHTWVVDVESQQVPDEAFASWAGAGWQAASGIRLNQCAEHTRVFTMSFKPY